MSCMTYNEDFNLLVVVDNFHIVRCIEKIIDDSNSIEENNNKENLTSYKNSISKTINEAELKETTTGYLS